MRGGDDGVILVIRGARGYHEPPQDIADLAVAHSSVHQDVMEEL